MTAMKDGNSAKKLPPTPWGLMPPRMRVLFVGGTLRNGAWLAAALHSDNACEVELDEVTGIAAGVTRLRDEVYDAIVISHEPDCLDALELLDAIRAGSSDEQPIIVLGAASEMELADLCFESGADVYLCVEKTTTRRLLWEVARARERHQLIAENRRLRNAQRHRLQLEHDEAARLLQQQRSLIAGLESISTHDKPDHESGTLTKSSIVSGVDRGPQFPPLPETLVVHYRELLRAYVIMGSGNLAGEMTRLAELLANANLTGQQLMLLHLQVLEEVISNLGSRSARHVLNRADLLIVEVMMNLAEGYRGRLLRQLHPPRQQLLPGFELVGLRAAG